MKNAALIAAIAASLTACAGAQPKTPPPITARCNEQPQWITKDEQGHQIGIFICFGEQSRLLYATRVLPPAPPAAPTPAPKVKIQPAHDPKTGRFVSPASAPVSLPTLGGTATEPKK